MEFAIKPTTHNPRLNLWLQLFHTPQLGPKTANLLLNHFGSIEKIFEQNITILSQFIKPMIAKQLLEMNHIESINKSITWLDQDSKNYILCYDDPLYPDILKQIVDPPILLFAKGNLELLNNQKFAIVGTRHPTDQGYQNAYNFANDLANNHLTIVSGLAAGIDKAAHLGALKGTSSTIGVIGTGIDLIYPKANQQLYYDIVNNNGLILSEFPLGMQALAQNFPRRNRIVAGLSIGLLVTESNIDGGSMITANMALEMGREVMAIPGSIHNPMTKGCHKLIKSGAKLVENTNDILEDLPIKSVKLAYNPTRSSNPILDIFGYDPITIDELVIKTKYSFGDLCALILELELEQEIVNCGGGRYQRIFK